MKQRTFSFFLIIGFLPLAIQAQSPSGLGLSLDSPRSGAPASALFPGAELPSKDILPLLPQGVSDAPDGQPMADLPEFDLSTRKPDAPVPSGPNRTEEAAIQLAQRIRFRKIKADVLANPEVKAALDSSKLAKTDREMRSLLRKHYDLLFTKMKATDPSLSEMIQEQYSLALTPLKQTIAREKQ